MWLPPATTFHVGCAWSESSPWLSKKRMSVSAGNDRIASSEADQMADAMGNRYRWVKPSPKRRDSRKSPSVWRSASGASSSAGASRLKRTISRSSERCDGLTRFRRCAKNPLAPRLLYSSPVRRHDTANDMSESRVATPSSPNSRTRFG